MAPPACELGGRRRRARSALCLATLLCVLLVAPRARGEVTTITTGWVEPAGKRLLSTVSNATLSENTAPGADCLDGFSVFCGPKEGRPNIVPEYIATKFPFSVNQNATIVGVEVRLAIRTDPSCPLASSSAALIGLPPSAGDTRPFIPGAIAADFDNGGMPEDYFVFGNTTSAFGLPAGVVRGTHVNSPQFGVVAKLPNICDCPILKHCIQMRLTYHEGAIPTTTTSAAPGGTTPVDTPAAPTTTSSPTTAQSSASRADGSPKSYSLVVVLIIVTLVVFCNVCLALSVLCACRYWRRRRARSRQARSSAPSARPSRRRGSNSSGPHRGRPGSKNFTQEPSVRRPGGRRSGNYDEFGVVKRASNAYEGLQLQPAPDLYSPAPVAPNVAAETHQALYAPAPAAGAQRPTAYSPGPAPAPAEAQSSPTAYVPGPAQHLRDSPSAYQRITPAPLVPPSLYTPAPLRKFVVPNGELPPPPAAAAEHDVYVAYGGSADASPRVVPSDPYVPIDIVPDL